MVTVRPPSQLNQVFLFGEFEFSVRSGELRKNGEVVRLQYQPLRVLQVLLEYSGEVVTRNEIRERAWPDDSIRDFDNSLRVAVAKLRQAFGDDPDAPQYIETVPRRGYRWLYPVTVQEVPPNVVVLESSTAPVFDEVSAPPRLTRPDSITSVVLKPSRRAVLLRRVGVSLALWVALLAAVWFLRPQPETPDLKVVPLATYSGLEQTPALSPDGKRVAFAWTGTNPTDPYRVYVKLVGEEAAQLVAETPPGASDGNPMWMPDGRSILFFRRYSEAAGIYQVSLGSPAERQLTTISLHGSPVKRGRFAVSSQGHTVVYPSRPAGQQQIALFLLDLATLQSRQLTFPPPESEGDSDPAYSHDGKSIVFARGSLESRQVYVIPANGGDTRQLTAHGIFAVEGVAWTLDDREILLGGQQLGRISASANGENPTAVPYLPGPVMYPFLRGDQLAYSLAWNNANIWKLHLRDASRAEGEPSKLIASTRQQAAAAFSPDGSQIAFQSDRSGTWEIWKSNRDGSNAVQLTHFGGPLTGTPRWSPDGRQIAFDSRAQEIPQIYVIPAGGGEPRQVTNNPAGDKVPAWSHDGKWLYYSSNRDGVTNIWKMPVDGGTEQCVTANGGIYAAESPDGEYLYFSRSPTDQALWRVPVKGGDEQLVAGAPTPFGCSHWAIGATGLYIVDRNGDLIFYDFAHRQNTTIIHRPGFLTDWSLAVSPDQREVVWAQIDARVADLMLVENFR